MLRIGVLAIRPMPATALMSGCTMTVALSGLLRTAKAGADNVPKTVGSFAATSADGKSNGFSLGFRTSDAWLFATNTMRKTFLASYNSVVQLSYFGFFEMASRISSLY